MRGNPLSRAASPDGRWAYTLYDGAGGTPFIHALDTSGRTARCIDLDALAGNAYLARLRLHLDGNALTIRDRNETELVVNTKTFRVRAPATAAAGHAGHDSGNGWSLVGWAVLGTLVASGSLLLARRRRRRPAFGR